VFRKGQIVCDYAGVVKKTSKYNELINELETVEGNDEKIAKIKVTS
jgi:hypothetical protein